MRFENSAVKNSLTYKALNMETWLTTQLNKGLAYFPDIANEKQHPGLNYHKKENKKNYTVTDYIMESIITESFSPERFSTRCGYLTPVLPVLSNSPVHLDQIFFSCYLSYMFPYISLHKCVLQGKTIFFHMFYIFFIFFHSLCKAVTVRAFCTRPRPARCKKEVGTHQLPSSKGDLLCLTLFCQILLLFFDSVCSGALGYIEEAIFEAWTF